MSMDYVFTTPPATQTPAVGAPGTTVAPAVGVDTSAGVFYISYGKGWLPNVPSTVAQVKLTAQGANIGSTNAFVLPGNGVGCYLVTTYIKVTRAGSSSSTMPSVTIGWTDIDGTAQTLAATSTSAGNATTTYAQSTSVINAANSSNITYTTASYATSGATSMQYLLQIRVTYLGG